ncbi:MAG: DUF5119 domain-containing protein [Prevotella sp.]|nr:DUF5119 domain-containing protein [Prevotella sp.]
MEWKKCFRLKVYIDRDDLIGGLAILLFEVAFSAIIGVGAMVLFSSCERRELYVYGDEFHSVELEVDWREYADSDPDGMTVWFYPIDTGRTSPYRSTTASVRHHDVYLPGGYYQGVVVDYSPEEYSRQEFLDMDIMQSARVEATPSSYQPDSLTVVGEGVAKSVSGLINTQLFGEVAWNTVHAERPAINQATGLYIVANQPESMALDTLHNRYVDMGRYGDYIPYKQRDTYQDSIRITTLYAQPTTLIWKLRIRVWIQSGFNYLWQMPASISGLSNGHLLALNENTDTPCLLFIDSWSTERTGTDSGYISATVSTFGLRPGTILPDRELHYAATRAGENDYYTNVCRPDQIKLNLSFLLRDHATLLHYHFNVGSYVVDYDNQLVLRVELGPDDFYPNNPNGPEPIVLPYVDAYNGTGFGADVTPWDDEPPVDITF